MNDFWEIGIKESSFGIHIGKEDYIRLSVSEKSVLKENKSILIGTCSHNIEDILSLDTEIWDYTGFGPMFKTETKKSHYPTLGIEELKKALFKTRIPLVPIGGIDLSNFFIVYEVGNILPASIGMLSNEKSLVKIVDFIRNSHHPVRESKPV